ncbi:hypothetical protein VPNG_00338 [Cytospora leucostoma]|uniref:Zn(2)-C6 fungal-type domain-containing protein n=1 Tax=Cytospora leucostoma TaxID=1230097 RepID=A0A423XN93_9PEZI|nr:hypothetical protein VPNG_00338 [Cytospora leucostoma]
MSGCQSGGGSSSNSMQSGASISGVMAGTARNYQQHLPQIPQQQVYPGPAPGSGGATKPIRRRMRMITSCLECRRRKLRCNKSNPCTNCLKFSRDCLYLGPKLDEASQLRLTEIKEKVGSLERQLERDVAKCGSRGFYQQRILADDVEGEFDEERDLEITPMVTLDLTYEDDADSTDDIMDLGVQVGKMRLTEKIGGLNRPRISEEAQQIETGLSSGIAQVGAGLFPPGLMLPELSPGPSSQSGPFSTSNGSDQTLPDFLRPGASYIPPTSGVFFGQFVQSPSLLQFLPTKPAGDRLLEHYFEAVHPIARCIHRKSFEVRYESFWEEATAGYEPRASVQAVVFAAWLSAAVAMDESVINKELGLARGKLIENMKVGTETALSKANFLRTTSVEAMQAFVMYLLCFLDIRTCEAQGPKPAIRREDYDTCLPDNCEEDQLMNAPRPAEDWTSTLFSLIRFEINEMMRIIWADRRKLEARKITLTQVLTKIEDFRKRMLEKYDRSLDERVPFQRYAKLVMHLLLYRLHLMILHPYYANTSNPMPQRLRSVLIMSGIMIIEIAIQLDTDPAFRPWRWYSGAYQQYQSSLILATEMFYHPNHKEANRIWACLDYVFGLDSHLPNDGKGRQILTEIMGKMGMYLSMRKTRAPTWTATANLAQQAVQMEDARGAGGRGGPQPATPPDQQPTLQPRGDIRHKSLEEDQGMKSHTWMTSPDTALPPQQQQQQNRSSISRSRPSLIPPSQQDTPVPSIMMAGLWGLPPPPPLNPESPGGSSSDGGSVVGTAQRHGGAAGLAAVIPPAGSGGRSGAAAINNVMDGEWSNYQEDAINALFPYDPQTGNFVGFADSVAIGVANDSDWSQSSQHQSRCEGGPTRGGHN